MERGRNSAEPRVLSTATALPPYRVGQDEVRRMVRGMFGGAHRDIDRLIGVFDNTGVGTRYSCVPVEWFSEDHTFPEKNALYVENALALSEKAARRALSRAGVEPGEVGAGGDTPTCCRPRRRPPGLVRRRARARGAQWLLRPR